MRPSTVPAHRRLPTWSLAATAAALAAAALAPSARAQTVDPSLTVGLPAVTLGGVTALGPSTAVVDGTVDLNSLTGTTAYVEYRGADGVLRRAPIAIAASLDPQKVSVTLNDLLPDSNYDVRLVAGNPLGLVHSPFALLHTPPAASVDLATGRLAPGGGHSGGGTLRIRGLVVACTIVGTAGNDVLRGTARNDVICGLGGRDRMTGLGGRDTIAGGDGDDRAVGGAGADLLYGNGGRDRLSGQSGNDRLHGGAGRDLLTGGRGRDRILGDSGNDALNARDGRRSDVASGGSGRDRATVDRGDRTRVERKRIGGRRR